LGDSRAKFHITSGIMVSGQGNFAPGPLFNIIKFSVSADARPDQQSIRVIPNLNYKQGYNETDGWKLKKWSRELTTRKLETRGYNSYSLYALPPTRYHMPRFY
jgi:hypothetical protein